MVGVMTFPRTTIGKKVIMAVTGLIGIGFVLGHMYGNLKVFFGPAEFNRYAEGLRELGAPIFTHSEPLWIVRLVLLAAVALHVWSAWSLYQDSLKARSGRYIVRQTLQTTAAARYIRFGGVVILLFIILHLMQFTWGVPRIHPDFRPGDAYHNLVTGFQSYGYAPAVIYLVAMFFLGFHLYHGAWSMCQTLGLNNKTTTKPLRAVALILAVVVAGGFAIVPLSVMLGLVA
ncbi:MAG: succinate dehydrogenase cytochrome b subunit [Chloroflexota bacterium]